MLRNIFVKREWVEQLGGFLLDETCDLGEGCTSSLKLGECGTDVGVCTLLGFEIINCVHGLFV